MNIVIIAGSPRQASLSYRVAVNLQNYFQNNSEHTVSLINMQDHNIPQMQSVWLTPEHAPRELQAIAETVHTADAFILVSPEYNGSYSPAMKNLLDHFPKQHHKPFGIVTASPGAFGGIRAAQQMQLLIAALFGIFSPYMLVVPGVDKKFDAAGNLIEPAFSNSIHQFATEFLWVAERITQKEEVTV